MTEIDTSAAAVERAAARGDVYVFEDAKGATNIGAFIRALAAERDRLRTMVDECAIYLKEGETPRQRMDRDHADVLGLMDLLAKEKLNSQAARAETGALIERAADWIEFAPEGKRSTDAAAIRALSTDATAALDQIRRQERAAGKAEGMREAALNALSDIRTRRMLLNHQTEALDIQREDAVYGIAEEIILAILARADEIEKAYAQKEGEA